MILLPLKCKLCNKIISPPDQTKIIGESEQVTNQKIIAKLMSHIGGQAKEEQKTGGPHAQALIEATLAAQNLHSALIIGCFEITPEMEQDRAQVFEKIHQLTRTFKISDEDLATEFRRATFSHGTGPIYGTHWEFIKELRDRYEGLGKYAPVQPKPATQQPEEVRP